MADKKDDAKAAYLKPTLIWLGATLGVIILLTAIAAGGYFAYTRAYKDRIFPGVSALGVRLDGLSPDEARKQLDQAIDLALDKGLPFVLDGQTSQVQVSGGNDTPDMILFDTDKAVVMAYRVGRENAIQKILYELVKARMYKLQVPVDIRLDRERIREAIEIQYQEKLPAAKDATFAIQVEGTEPVVRVVPEIEGSALDLSGVFEKLERQAQILDFQAITLHATKIKADRVSTDLQQLIEEAENMLARPRLVFSFDGENYPISTSTLAGWISADLQNDTVTIDKTAFASSIHQLAKNIEVESKSGKIEVKDGQIVSFEAGTVGRKVNIDKTLEPVLSSWPPSSTFPLIVEEERGQITGNDLEQFGIKELIGIGKSNYLNSPPNRIKNIRKAVYDHVNGTLIAPGETFSMLKTLGPIDGKNGWLPELVIKGDKTMPEYGGGLCQIGTTMFRGAVATGLPVTERRNHSYRVVYYEPAGTDATIYEPAPDFKFVNDTGKHIFINAYIVGSEITFEFWGTKDGREVTQTKPRIYNIVSPPATKLIETEDLPLGKKKCTESAHAGADAEFSTAVTYADGTKREETFRSHYRPWGAVCLIGVEKKADTTTEAATE